MAKDMVVWKPQINKTRKYTKKKVAKGNIFAKASKEQRFLGKTLPRMAWGAAKWAWRHPIASTALMFAGKPIANAYRRADKGYSFSEFRNYNKKGRKIV